LKNKKLFDSQTGTIVGSFNAKNTPAFSGTRGFFLNGPHFFGSFGTLQARDVNTNSVLWSFAGDGRLQSAVLAPLRADGSFLFPVQQTVKSSATTFFPEFCGNLRCLLKKGRTSNLADGLFQRFVVS
jgi:hypothetical protein